MEENPVTGFVKVFDSHDLKYGSVLQNEVKSLRWLKYRNRTLWFSWLLNGRGSFCSTFLNNLFVIGLADGAGIIGHEEGFLKAGEVVDFATGRKTAKTNRISLIIIDGFADIQGSTIDSMKEILLQVSYKCRNRWNNGWLTFGGVGENESIKTILLMSKEEVFPLLEFFWILFGGNGFVEVDDIDSIIDQGEVTGMFFPHIFGDLSLLDFAARRASNEENNKALEQEYKIPKIIHRRTPKGVFQAIKEYGLTCSLL